MKQKGEEGGSSKNSTANTSQELPFDPLAANRETSSGKQQNVKTV